MERGDNDNLVTTHINNQREALYRRAPFPLYGLPSEYTGTRALGETGTTDDDDTEIIDYLGLTHGRHDGPADAPRLDVITTRAGAALDPVDLLADHAGVFPSPHDQARSLDLAGMLTAACGPLTPITTTVIIAGTAFEATGVQSGNHWFLQADLGTHLVIVAGTHWPTAHLALDEIDDLGPYMNGTRQLLRR